MSNIKSAFYLDVAIVENFGLIGIKPAGTRGARFQLKSHASFSDQCSLL